MSDRQTETIELFAVIDAVGDYGCGTDPERARADYEDRVGDLSDADAFRCVKVVLTVELPRHVTLTGTAPDNGGKASLTSVE